MWLTTFKRQPRRDCSIFSPASSTDLVAADMFAPSHCRFMEAFKGFINKGTPLPKQLAILFIEGFSEAPNETVAGFWKAACVLSLSYTGLGAIGWFVKAHEKFLMSGKQGPGKGSNRGVNQYQNQRGHHNPHVANMAEQTPPQEQPRRNNQPQQPREEANLIDLFR